MLLVPMLKEKELIGAIVIYGQEVRPFTDKHIELLTSFAAQAVIAIENTRLLNELRERTDDLSESLQQQTATADVLKVISSSPGELEPVFQSMLENAVRICEAKFATLWRVEDGTARMAYILHITPELAEFLRRGEHKPGPLHPMSRVIKFRQTLHIADFQTDPSYLERDPVAVAGAELGGIRTMVVVPMLKDGDLVGAIAVFRQEVRPFTDKQIEIVKNFASQAVIAIENTRLLNELRQRTVDLSASLRSTDGDVRGAARISSSPTGLAPVFDTILTNATRLCEGNFAALWQYDGEMLVGAAQHNVSPGFAELCRNIKLRLGPEGAVRKAALERRTVQVADITIEPGFSPIVLQHEHARTVLAVPLLREKDLVGVVGIWRREVQPFTNKQIALVETFADQAAIAIENVRLFDEIQDKVGSSRRRASTSRSSSRT